MNQSIRLTSTHIKILNIFCEHPFKQLTTVSEMLNKSEAYASAQLSSVPRISGWNYVPTCNAFLYILTCVGWICPTEIAEETRQLLQDKSQYDTLTFLTTRPYADNYDLMEKFQISHGGAKLRMYSLYKVFGVSGKTQPRLRMYHKLGWYRPFELQVGDDS